MNDFVIRMIDCEADRPQFSCEIGIFKMKKVSLIKAADLMEGLCSRAHESPCTKLYIDWPGNHPAFHRIIVFELLCPAEPVLQQAADHILFGGITLRQKLLCPVNIHYIRGHPYAV